MRTDTWRITFGAFKTNLLIFVLFTFYFSSDDLINCAQLLYLYVLLPQLILRYVI